MQTVKLKRLLLKNEGGLWGNDPSEDSITKVFRSTEQTVDGQWSFQIDEVATRDLSEFSNIPYLENGDLLITKSSGSTSHIGKTTLVNEQIESLRATYSNFMQRVHLKQSCIPRFYWYVLNSSFVKQQFPFLSSTTTGLANLTAASIGNIIVPYFERLEQEKILLRLDAKCSAIDSLIASKQSLLEKLEEYRKAVITKAVTKGLDPNVNMKDSGIPWIGEIPSNWQIVKVKQVTSLVTDGAHVAPETENGVYDFVSTVDIDNDTIDFNSCLKTSESSYEYLVATKCKPNIGDVLISKDGTVGKTVVVKDDRNFVVASSLVILRPKVNLVMPYFLNYALQSNIVQETLASLMHGAGLKRVSVEKNANLQIVLPPIGEQQEIISILDEKCSAINCLISKEQETVKKLREYRSSLITAAVTGKIDVADI